MPNAGLIKHNTASIDTQENKKAPKQSKPKRQKAEKGAKDRRKIVSKGKVLGNTKCKDNDTVGGLETAMEVCPPVDVIDPRTLILMRLSIMDIPLKQQSISPSKMISRRPGALELRPTLNSV